jgi:myosin heavy subunit
LTNIHSEFEGHTDYVKGDDRRRWDKEFGIRHYAGTVIYTVNGFVDKNRDSQQDVFFDALAKSKSNFIQELCQFKDLLSRVAQLGEVKRLY